MTKLDIALIVATIIALVAMWWVLGQVSALEVIIKPLDGVWLSK